MRKFKIIVKFVWHWRMFSLAVLALIVGLSLYFAHLHTASYIVLAAISLVEVIPLLWGMWQDIRTGSYGIDILAATAIVASVLLRQYWAAIIVVIMLTGGESLEDYANHRAMSELSSLLSHAPTIAHLLKNRKQFDVKADK